ncbi:hypothetical protein OF846_004199 [Rhodotorula toruloides]|nr:hypothetical protein OF846_004199 [Rhodotorula toruloides]
MAVSNPSTALASSWFDEQSMQTIRNRAARDEQLNRIQKHQKALHTDYWGQPNGRITGGVLHLAYLADESDQLDPPFPDLVRAEYERIDAALEVYVGATGHTVGGFLIYGQSGAGKSRSLRYLKALKFERKEPVIVTETGRDDFDLFCEEGAFFDIPLNLLKTRDIVPLRPILVLVDVDPCRPEQPLPHVFNRRIKNIVTCFATSPRQDRYQGQLRNFLRIAFWVIDLWPDNELEAFTAHCQVPSTRFASSPRVYLTPKERPSCPETHLPPYSEVVPPPQPEDLDKLFQLPMRRVTPGSSVAPSSASDASAQTAGGPTQADEATRTHMPSLFLPEVSTAPPSYAPSSGNFYTFNDYILYMSRTVGDAYKYLSDGMYRKSSDLRRDIFPTLDFHRTLNVLYEARTYKPSAPAWILGMPVALQPRGFDLVFLEVPTPGVPRPNAGMPNSTVIPASAAVQEWFRKELEAAK